MTEPPVMHADLYRVESYEGIGIEDFLDSHLSLIEWPDRAQGLMPPENCWKIEILLSGEGREILVYPPMDSPGR